MSDIFDEALNDANDEKKVNFFRKILPTVITLTVIISIFMAYYSWRSYKIQIHNEEMGDLLTEIAKNSDFSSKETAKESIKKIDNFIKEAENNQVELAEIYKLIHFLRDKDSKDAYNHLDWIIANSKYSDITRSFARLIWLNILVDEQIISYEMQVRARDYMQYFETEKQPFFVNATLLKALFYKKNGQNDKALEYAKSVLNMEQAQMVAREEAKAIIYNIEFNSKK